MPSFGILTLNNHQEESYYQEIGIQAELGGMTVHRFAPNRIDPFTEKVTGETYHNGEWSPGTFEIPDILYDRCFYSTKESFKTNAPIVEWLKHRTLFLGYGLPNKWKVHEVFRTNPYLNHYTIDTVRAVTANAILNELSKRNTVLIKPESGSQGKGIFVVEKEGKGFVVSTDRRGKISQKAFPDSTVLKHWLNLQLRQTAFLVQPYLPLRTADNQPFDVRIVMQRDGEGKWIERGRGIRVGKKGGIAANLHNEGELMDYDRWLKKLPRMKRSYLKTELASITERVPKQLEESFGPLFEIGLDLGIDRDGAIWILEANSKPGHRTIVESGKISRQQLAEAPLRYGIYLLGAKGAEGK
ncbi:MAG TPA: YheC/YheD family protein [Bacillales bacterium]|nr:YheC/YheD family protein [Bacillales bacterium]